MPSTTKAIGARGRTNPGRPRQSVPKARDLAEQEWEYERQVNELRDELAKTRQERPRGDFLGVGFQGPVGWVAGTPFASCLLLGVGAARALVASRCVRGVFGKCRVSASPVVRSRPFQKSRPGAEHPERLRGQRRHGGKLGQLELGLRE